MLAPSATHRGAPFVGRVRERGLLLHLLQEALEGPLALVRVAAPPGMGRRRLIGETLRAGPDAEWVHLASGGVEADLPRWIRTELLDLLETYPEAPVPSWCLHVLGRWAPALHRRAPVPCLGREPLPRGRIPEVAGAAIGTLLVALTGRTPVVVDAGLWPEPSSAAGRALAALAGVFRTPGAVLLAAVGAEEARLPDESGVRTLELGPLPADAVLELAEAWTGGRDAETLAFADWLTRVTGGHPFFLQEAVRWLEEMGHLRVDEERRRLEFMDAVGLFPIPLTLEAVLDARYGRLPPPSARLLHLLAGVDGTAEIEAVRRRAGMEDDTFDEAVAVLRRRDFLLQRSSRRPLALASPLWRAVAEAGARRFTRHAHRPPARPEPAPVEPDTPLARTLRELAAVRREPGRDDAPDVLVRVARRLRGRTGPAWDGARGRLAVLAARRRLGRDHIDRAALWIRWGLDRLDPDRHPALRRTLLQLDAERLERNGLPEEAASRRRTAHDEAIAAGHAVSAARILAARAEGRRRLGRLQEARRLAAGAASALKQIGLEVDAARAVYTRVSALVDARRLEEAALALASFSGDEEDPLPRDLRLRLEALQAAPLHPVLRSEPDAVGGWGWGLDHPGLWLRSRETLRELASAAGRTVSEAIDRLAAEADALAAAGYRTAAADLEELRLGFLLDEGTAACGPAATRLSERLRALDSPSRFDHVAAALRELPAEQREAVRAHLTPLQLHTEAPPPPPAARLRLCLTGRPHIENADGVLPLCAWPEWWQELALRVVSADLLGETVTREEAAAILSRAGETPEGGLEAALHAGNTLWGGPSERAEGIRVLGDRLAVSWDGIACDARDLLASARTAERTAAAKPGTGLRDWEAVLDAVGGPYLPGVGGPTVARAREAVHAAIEAALTARRETAPDPETARLWRWLEGAGRVIPVAAYAAAVSARRGRPGLARVLAPGSP